MVEHNIPYKSHTYGHVSKEFGYVSPSHERALFLEETGEVAEKQIVADKIVKEQKSDKKSFTNAFADLPQGDTAGLNADLKFVYYHAAISRQLMLPEGEFVTLTAEDLKDCPSPGAAALLQYYIHNVSDFFKQVLDKLKKERSNEEATERDIEDFASIAQIEAELAKLEGESK
jgi:hypothetical protein